MTLYRVRWEIDIEADSTREAAQKALVIHRDPASTATTFDVQPRGGGDYERIDLSESTGAEPTDGFIVHLTCDSEVHTSVHVPAGEASTHQDAIDWAIEHWDEIDGLRWDDGEFLDRVRAYQVNDLANDCIVWEG